MKNYVIAALSGAALILSSQVVAADIEADTGPLPPTHGDPGIGRDEAKRLRGIDEGDLMFPGQGRLQLVGGGHAAQTGPNYYQMRHRQILQPGNDTRQDRLYPAVMAPDWRASHHSGVRAARDLPYEFYNRLSGIIFC